MKQLIRTEVDDANRLIWILSGDMKDGAPRHLCADRANHGACGFGDGCCKCLRV